MKVKSKLFLNEIVENTKPKINSDSQYYCAYVVYPDGTVKPAMFTDTDISKATTRAQKNVEDMPPQHKSFFHKLFFYKLF